MDISVIVITRNAAKFIQTCLESVRSEIASCPDLESEIIIVDNASSDGSGAIVAAEYPEALLILNDRNLGPAGADNAGIKKSTGKYLCLVNADIAMKQGCVRELHRYMEAYPEIGIMTPMITDEGGRVQRSCTGFPTTWNMFCRALALDTLFPWSKTFGGHRMPFWAHDTLRKVDVIGGRFWMVRRDALFTVGLLDENFFMYGEDMDWCKRFSDAGWLAVFYPWAKAVSLGAGPALAPVRFYIEKRKANLLYWRKHHGPLGEATTLALMIIHESLRYVGGIAISKFPGAGSRSGFNRERSRAALKWLIGLGSQMFKPDFTRPVSGADGNK